jgi:hypothetical protein
MSEQTMEAPAATETEGNGKRRKLPEVRKVFLTKEELDQGQAEAINQGHDYDTKKYKVTGNGTERFVLGFSPANAVSQVYDAMGVTVEELDAKARAARVPKSPEAIFASLSDEDKKVIEKLLKASKHK